MRSVKRSQVSSSGKRSVHRGQACVKKGWKQRETVRGPAARHLSSLGTEGRGRVGYLRFARGRLPLPCASSAYPQSKSIFIFSLVLKKRERVTTRRGTLSLRLESHQSLELQSCSSHSNSNWAPTCSPSVPARGGLADVRPWYVRGPRGQGPGTESEFPGSQLVKFSG